MLRTLSLSQIPAFSSAICVVAIDGSETPDLETFYDRIAKLLLFPDYFGRNLDALFDCITALEQIDQQEVMLVLEHPELFLSEETPEKRRQLEQILLDATLEENRYDGKKFSAVWLETQPVVLVFATNNAHKAKEVEQVLGPGYVVKTLKDIGCLEDIEETADTLEGNALLKARYVKERYGYDCFSEDTGLEVTALQGAPGVHTARYAGEQRSSEDNIQLLLKNLKGATDRSARFRTIIALAQQDRETLLEGICEGRIAEEKQGNGGFGYDPVFIPDGYDQTFATLGDDVKNQISHRAKATLKLIEILQTAQS